MNVNLRFRFFSEVTSRPRLDVTLQSPKKTNFQTADNVSGLEVCRLRWTEGVV